MSNTKKTVFAAMMLAVGIVLPMAFHAVPKGGPTFAPMHLPIFLAGMISGPFYGALTALLCPLLSSLFTGMPPFATLPVMMIELLCYSVFSGLVFRLVKTKRFLPDVYIALIAGMLAGRALGGFTSYIMYIGGRGGAYSWTAFYTAYFVTCLPGVAIQLVLVPAVVELARRTGFLRESDRFITDKHYKDNAKRQKEFFDGLAGGWRENCGLSEEKIEELFVGIDIKSGARVLDVACGKGVIDSYLLSRGCKVDAIDVSENMIELAKKNSALSGVDFSVADFYTYKSDYRYDVITVFDAYPHFLNRNLFAEKACELLKDGGELWIFFDENREKINAHHGAASESVSAGLKSADEEIKPYRIYFDVVEKTDDENGYRIGFKKKIRAKNNKKNRI